MSRRRVLLYVQHLLGIGHLKRAVTLARALAAQALEVTIVSGGREVPGLTADGVRWVQLPSAAALDEQFKVIVDERGDPIDEAWRERRKAALMRSWREIEPHVLIVELFPFGRRPMRFELLPLLDAAIAGERRPVIVSSVRDVLGGGQRDASRQDEMRDCFDRYFDHLLVHGDPAVIGFERTFRHALALGGRLRYTGYVVDRMPANAATDGGAGEVLVSAGGGAVGAQLLEAAVRCREMTVFADRTWRVLTGIMVADPVWSRLQALIGAIGAGRVVLERSRSDFRSLLKGSSLSISQAGYNTCVEILDAGARAVVVPFAGGNETEQTLRARTLADRGCVECLEAGDLAPGSLAAAVDRAARRPAPPCGGVDLDGARRSAQWVAEWAAGVRW